MRLFKLILIIFQFHYGTIEGSARSLRRLRRNQFQFHYGTIEGEKEKILSKHTGADFNSTMVRLRDSLPTKRRIIHTHFNSTMVRLREECTRGENSTIRISIPLWYD